jgi:hypothetical protein
MVSISSRCAVPAWMPVLVLGVGALSASASAMTTVLVIALGLMGARTLVTACVWKRAVLQPSRVVANRALRALGTAKGIHDYRA